MPELVLDAAGRCRSPASMPGFHTGRPPRNKGLRYATDPPTVEEIVAVLRTAGEGLHGQRLRGLTVALWRAGLRIHEALALGEADLDHPRGALLIRRGKGGKRREVGMDEWAWEQLQPWLASRPSLPVGPLFCVIKDPRPVALGQAPPLERSSGGPRRVREFAVASLHTNCVTRTPSRWPMKACR